MLIIKRFRNACSFRDSSHNVLTILLKAFRVGGFPDLSTKISSSANCMGKIFKTEQFLELVVLIKVFEIHIFEVLEVSHSVGNSMTDNGTFHSCTTDSWGSSKSGMTSSTGTIGNGMSSVGGTLSDIVCSLSYTMIDVLTNSV